MSTTPAATPVWVRPDRPFVTSTTAFPVCAILTFPLVAAFVLLAAPRLAALEHRSMPVLVANHLVTLGWGTMVAMGALHQLLPAAAGVRRDPGKEVWVHFALHTLGVVLMSVGFWIRQVEMISMGGLAVVAGVAILLTTAASTLRRRTRWLPSLTYITVALVCLGGVTAWGFTLAANWHHMFWTDLLLPMGLVVHLALGLVGWFGLLVTGVSYYLLTRFTAIKTLDGMRPRAIFAVMTAAVIAMVLGAFAGPALMRVGLLALAAAGLLYAADIHRFTRAQRTEAPDITIAHWRIIAGETVLLSLGAGAYALGLLPGDATRWVVAGVSLFLLGWVTLAITGQAYKVTPFLMWYYRYRLGMPALEIPRLPAPYWPAWGSVQMILLTAGGLGVSLGVVAGEPWVSAAGGAAFFAGACLFAYLLGYSWLPRLVRSEPGRTTKGLPMPPG
ncbi:MAG: hypothetical protein HY660_04905 [Armatimonadetes bacterium]|nr:hypothetical protein [Armatimonadota bacterium]